MDIDSLNLFMDVYRHLNLKRVAELRRIPPAKVTRRLQKLEADFGVTLFDRTTRNMVATAAGQKLFERLEPLLSEFSQLQSSLKEKPDAPLDGKLRITTPVSFGLTCLIPLLNAFRKEHPLVQIDAVIADSQLDLTSERIDIAIRYGVMSDSNLIGRPLWELDYAAVCADSYLQEHGSPNVPQDMNEHVGLPFLLPGLSERWKFRKTETEEEISQPITGDVYLSSSLAVKEAAKAGFGIALLPTFLVDTELRNGTLIKVFDDYQVTPNNFNAKVWMLFRGASHRPKRIDAFADFAVDFFKRQPGR